MEEIMIRQICLNGKYYKIIDERYDDILTQLNSYDFNADAIVVDEETYNKIEHKENVFYFIYEDEEEEEDNNSGGNGSGGNEENPSNPNDPVTPPTFDGMELELNAAYDIPTWSALCQSLTNITFNNYTITIS